MATHALTRIQNSEIKLESNISIANGFKSHRKTQQNHVGYIAYPDK